MQIRNWSDWDFDWKTGKPYLVATKGQDRICAYCGNHYNYVFGISPGGSMYCGRCRYKGRSIHELDADPNLVARQMQMEPDPRFESFRAKSLLERRLSYGFKMLFADGDPPGTYRDYDLLLEWDVWIWRD